MTSLRVLVVDDHEIVTTGLSLLLGESGEIEVVASVTDPRDTLDAVARTGPDVVLTDLSMPGMAGTDLIAQLREAHPDVPVLILSATSNPVEIANGIRAGAVGFVPKHASLADIRVALAQASRGEMVVSPEVGAALARHLREPQEKAALSEREREILTLVSLGMTNGQICRRLYLSEATVKTYLARCYTKLGVNDRAAAVRAAITQGLIDAEG